MSRRVVSPGTNQPRSQSSSAISDVTSPVKLVGKVRTRLQASSGNSDSANCPGYEAGDKQQLIKSPHTRNRGRVCYSKQQKKKVALPFRSKLLPFYIQFLTENNVPLSYTFY